MTNDHKKLQINLHRFWHPINIYNNLKSLYFAIIPKGSKSYQVTYGFLRIFLKQLHLLNIYYKDWIRRYDTFTDDNFTRIHQNISEMEKKPEFSVIMPVYNPDLSFFQQAIDSVINQVYPNWELCIADDASTDPSVKRLIQTFAEKDKRIKYIIRKSNGHISAASNSALDLASKEFIALLDHDDLLHPLALYYVAEEINAHPDSVIIYSDEDKITKRRKRLDPYFKPDFDYELLLSQNMVSHLGVYRHASVSKVGGFRVGLEGSQDYDLLLRVLETCRPDQIHHIPRPLYHWRISNKSVARDVNIKPYAVDAGIKAIKEHLARRSVKAHVEFLPELAGYSVTYALPQEPSVSLIVPTESLTDTLYSHIAELVSITSYKNFHVQIVTPTSKNNLSMSFPPGMKDQVEIIHLEYDHKASFAEMINFAISKIKTDYICLIDALLNEFPQNWLYDLVGQAAQAGVGAVAPKIIDINKRVFSSGIILMPERIATHLSKGEERAVNGYFGWAKLCRGYSALSEKCLLFKRDHWRSVDGFDTNLQSPMLSGVDFCLKLKEQGLRNILRPSIELVQKSSNQHIQLFDDYDNFLAADQAYVQSRWGTIITNDPAFNPNLTIVDEGKILVNLSPNINFHGVY